jgi:hydroxymethylbilane synthase
VTTLRIGTRRSRLAMAQAGEVARRLAAYGVESELVPLQTAGDRGERAPDPAFAGVKGLFVAEIVRALEDGQVDLAVHSAKDLPAEDPFGVVVAAVPERADPRDVLVTREQRLRPTSTVGTSSPRRSAQLAASRPHLRVVAMRGNVDTRLAKVEEGEVDAVVLAAAGLSRLSAAPAHVAALSLDEMLPAPGQGALAVQARAGDAEVLERVRRIEHRPSRAAFDAERALVHLLGGGCALPLGAHAEPQGGGVLLRAVAVSPDGRTLARGGAEDEPKGAAEAVARQMLARGAAEILAAVRDAS